VNRRIRIHIGVGDILQLVGVFRACLAVGHLAGLWWGILLGAVYVIVDANLTYGQHRLSVGLPNRNDWARAKFLAGKPVRAMRLRGRAALAKVRA
jgi:hypothetical protein